jgi:hypothetical protein
MSSGISPNFLIYLRCFGVETKRSIVPRERDQGRQNMVGFWRQFLKGGRGDDGRGFVRCHGFCSSKANKGIPLFSSFNIRFLVIDFTAGAGRLT